MRCFTHPRVIVTADDLGLNPTATRAVVQSLGDGVVSHASLLVNMSACEEACELVRAARLESHIGLHFNLTEGTPLTDALRHTSFCVEGRFTPRHFLSCLALSNENKRAIAEEARAQITAARAQGIPLNHLDSHNDVHILSGIAGIVVAIAREFGITRVRPARNCGKRQGVLRWPLHRYYNSWLSRQGLRQVRYFGTLDDILWLPPKDRLGANLSAEIMTHPRLGPNGTVVDAPSFERLTERLQQFRRRSLSVR